MSDCHRPASFWFSGTIERIGLLRPMSTGPFVVAALARLAQRYAGRAFIHAMRKMACAESSCGHGGQEVQQFPKIFQQIGPLTGQAFPQSSGLT
jgi:hypothetical protein